uniref:Uncharacterized protein n=1 Tax=Arundo donax TaxID=35708 RepID=A0A0A9HQ88_ARUDO
MVILCIFLHGRVTAPPRHGSPEISLGAHVATSHPAMPGISTKRST